MVSITVCGQWSCSCWTEIMFKLHPILFFLYTLDKYMSVNSLRHIVLQRRFCGDWIDVLKERAGQPVRRMHKSSQLVSHVKRSVRSRIWRLDHPAGKRHHNLVWMHRRKHPHGKLTIIGRAQQYKFIRPKKTKHPTWLDQTDPRAFQQQENVNPFDD